MTRKEFWLVLAGTVAAVGFEASFADTTKTTKPAGSTRPETTQASTSTTKSGFIRLDRAKFYYEESGEGPPLVLIHGGGIDSRMWDGQFKTFAENFRVIRYDVRGHGRSRSPRASYSDHEDLRSIMKELRIDKAHVAGLSMGGRIAIDFALAYPEMVMSLIPVAPGLSGYPLASEQLRSYFQELNSAHANGDLDGAVDVVLRYWTDGPHRTPEQVDPQVRGKVQSMARAGIHRFVSQVGNVGLDPPAYGRLTEIRAPTLCIVGDLDVSDILDIVDLLVEKIPGARKAVVSGVAHMVNMERPDEFSRIVLDFLSSQ